MACAIANMRFGCINNFLADSETLYNSDRSGYSFSEDVSPLIRGASTDHLMKPLI